MVFRTIYNNLPPQLDRACSDNSWHCPAPWARHLVASCIHFLYPNTGTPQTSCKLRNQCSTHLVLLSWFLAAVGAIILFTLSPISGAGMQIHRRTPRVDERRKGMPCRSIAVSCRVALYTAESQAEQTHLRCWFLPL